MVASDGLNLLVNNAGVTTKFTKLALVKSEQLLDNLVVNTVAPIMLTKVPSYLFWIVIKRDNDVINSRLEES